LTFLDKVLIGLFSPRRVFCAIWKRTGLGSLGLRLRYDAVARPHYAYGVYYAAVQAKRLGLNRISVIELGVAGGNGLLIMERHAQSVEQELGIKIDVYGFDSGRGLPACGNFRDMPYFFKAGYFVMDIELLRSRLRNAQLIIGDIKETVRTFHERYKPAPIGFIAFDVDLYSSSRDAFAILDLPAEFLLPRILCHFDDIVGPDLFLMNEYVGELLAIKEFNDGHLNRKVAPVYGLAWKRIFPSKWTMHIFAFHYFDHPLYDRFIGTADEGHSLRLRIHPT
jgi:hypothetical protein